MNKKVLLTTLGRDPHTQGMFKFSRIAHDAGFKTIIIPPDNPPERTLKSIQEIDPDYLGFSYRLSPDIGLKEMDFILKYLFENNLLKKPNGIKRPIAFAGLPETVDLVVNKFKEFNIFGIKQTLQPNVSIGQVLDFLGITDSRRETIIQETLKRLIPPKIEILDQLAESVFEDFQLEPPLKQPSESEKNSYVQRIKSNWPERPILRTHYGEPGDTIEPTVMGIRKISDAGIIDEMSLGSSDLSQRYYNQPDKWIGRKNDGGVPYKNFSDLVALRESAKFGNFPSVKPYAHVINLENFVDECIKAGMLIGSHQAVPLFWFNKMDGRGPAEVKDSINEHIRTVKKLVHYNIPVEMNDPNHWSSRWASDAVVVSDYGLIASVMKANNVKDIVFQFQFNKPKETSDFGDIAKFSAVLDVVNNLIQKDNPVDIWIETRTGTDSFEPDLDVAKKHLARSTLLQMLFNPHAMHLVSYCEALYAAKPEDIILSSSIIRRAVKTFHKHKPDLIKILSLPEVQERKDFLVKESSYLLKEIAKLNPKYNENKPEELYLYLADPDTLYDSLEKGYMMAPGIFTEPFSNLARETYTDVIQGGFINSVDPKTLKSISEAERIQNIKTK